MANERYVIYIIERLENGLRKIDWICDMLSILSQPENELSPHEEEVVAEYLVMISGLTSFLQFLLSYWDVYLNEVNSRVVSSRYQAETVSQARGRPSFDVEKSQLEYLRCLNFTWTETANLICVSRMTLYRRRIQFDLLDDQSHERQVGNEELTGIIHQLRCEIPYCGESMIMGHSRSMGVFCDSSQSSISITQN